VEEGKCVCKPFYFNIGTDTTCGKFVEGCLEYVEDDGGSCNKCDPAYSRWKGTCKKCASDEILNDKGECTKMSCPEECSTCSKPGICSSCKDGLKLSNGKCDCGVGYWADNGKR
jgi:hypothetical protein